MEYRCRLGTPTGQIVEQFHVAESELRLRDDLEQKGFCVIALQPRHVLGRFSTPFVRRKRVPGRDFLIFNQELATLLKAGMPLVQSLDILRTRVTHATFKSMLDDVYERVKAGAALSEAFSAQGDAFTGACTALLAGAQPEVLRRYVGYESDTSDAAPCPPSCNSTW